MKLRAHWVLSWGLAAVVIGLSASIAAQTNQRAAIQKTSELTISPSGPVIVESGSHKQFTANAIGSGGAEVTWAIEGEECGKRDCGSVSRDGFYAAPNQVAAPLPLKIVARETAAPFLTSSEQITVVPSKTQHRAEPCKSSEPGYCNLSWQSIKH